MKLLNPIENTTEKDKLLAVKSKELSTLESRLTLKRQELNKVTLELEITNQKQLVQFETDKELYEKQIGELKSEVSNLDAKRKELLLPLDDRWKEIEATQAVLSKKETELTTNTQLVNEQLDDLQERLSDVAEREQDAKILGQKQKIAQQGIDKQKEQIILQNKSLNEMVMKANQDFKNKERDLNVRTTTINLKESNLIAREEQLFLKEQKLVDKERQINDKYATLQRTLERYEQR